MHSIYYSAKTRIQLDLIISYDPFEFLFQLQCVLSLTHGNKALAYDLSFLHFFTYFLFGNWKKEGRKQCGADKNESKERLSCMFEQLNNGFQREYGFLFHFARAGPVIAFRVAFSRFPSACSSCICRLFYGISVLVRVFEPLKAFHSEHCDRNKWNAWSRKVIM